MKNGRAKRITFSGAVERPILFSGSMVKAILEGRKTQTRRVVKGEPVDMVRFIGSDNKPTGEYGWCSHERVISKHVTCPYGNPGDHLWVRETFRAFNDGDTFYRADQQEDYIPVHADDEPEDWKWQPAIFMPRSQSRITLEVTAVLVQRLQEITEEDAKAEGVEPQVLNGAARGLGDALGVKPLVYMSAYANLWNKINGKKHPWESNPWVWCVEFRTVAPDATAT